MGAVSQREYLDFHTREAERKQADETIGQAAEEYPTGPPTPQAGRHNTRGQRRPATSTAPPGTVQPHSVGEGDTLESEWERLEHGEDHGVPAYPDPLPLAHTYGYVIEGQKPAERHKPLDVGPAKPYFWGGMAHGVDGPVRYGGRPQPTAEQRREHEATAALPFEPKERFDPIPVYVVSQASGNRPLVKSALSRKAVPASGANPVPVAGKDPHRTSVRLLNESSTAIRLLTDPVSPGGASTTQDTGNGIVLPASMSSYLEIKTQDQLWAVADSGNAVLYLSVISEYSVPGGA